ncbi:hypothetical protein F4778DRAFT_142430 [Xylariomycetidae sp. FL2044]|nr:hypothetical protein F4778DRAFT_142430 [Xylariomycetidae sp. FL2044]
MDQPPPPPPHGQAPKSTNPNLPPGKYDIFIIPPHSSGSGFLYLPSMKPHANSFAAGFASAMILSVAFQSMGPALRTWWSSFEGMGNMGMVLLMIGVGVGAWALGRTQQEGGPRFGGGFGGGMGNSQGGYGPPPGGYNSGQGQYGPTPNGGPPPNAGAPPPPPPHSSPPPRQPGPPPTSPGAEKPKSSWQQRPQTETPKGSWEKAREETRRREEERKAKEAEQRAKEAEQRRKEEIARRLKELREKEARERARREQEVKERLEREAREKAQKETEEREKQEQEKSRREQEKAQREKQQRESRAQELRERQLRERLEREKALREKLEKEAAERKANRLKEEEAAATAAAAAAKLKEEEKARKSTYAYSSVGEKTNPWPNGKPPSQPPPSPAKPNPTPASAKRPPPPPPTAKTFNGADEETYSYRPYDQPRAHTRRRSGETVFTESSYAASQTTARTTPPPSMRGPYTTKDPDKIVIKAVYGFLNQYSKSPASQLISGVGPVTDGLILRITTEGIFIDDDVRGVPQREWDVKAWTLKQMEVWCPSHCFNDPNASAKGQPKTGAPRFKLSRGQSKTLTGDDADSLLVDLLQTCNSECRLGPNGGCDTASSYTNNTRQSGEWKHRGLHVLRATIRDQEGKRYMFVLGEEEGWKVAVGLQRLRKGTQVRQLGIQTMPPLEARNTLEFLGWGNA